MKNFNVYDPMKKGQGLVLDGQTLAHLEVRKATCRDLLILMDLSVQVLLNNEGTEDGTLLRLLCRCATPSGSCHLIGDSLI
jgi:DNA mismatch repair protein MSH6